MNARVFLLVLVTGAFMAVWDADCPTSASSGIAEVRPYHNALSPSQIRPAVIPLPIALPSGTWQVFNHDGDTFRITIEGRTPGRKTDTVTQSKQEHICVVTGTDGIRWCLIQDSVEVTLEAGASLR